MTAPVSRALMSLAMCCMGESRREWALAMQAEFEVAAAEGEPFAFATGCLIAAWCEMPKHAEGRLVLANYTLALGLLIPMAVLQFAVALGSSLVFIGGVASSGATLGGTAQSPALPLLQFCAAPCLLALWPLLGIAHLRLAWVLVDRDWTRVVKVSALIGATLATLFILTVGALVLDVTLVMLEAAALVMLQAAAMAIELTAVTAVARRHARLFSGAALEMAAS
jgi:hypothetical protein